MNEIIPEEFMTSEMLASFIVDALLRAHLIRPEQIDEARALIAEEIHVLNLSGDVEFPKI